MICGSCRYADGCCYTSMPPKVRCNITGRYHYYSDECDCKDELMAGKAEEIDKFKEILSKPGVLVADRPGSVSITGEEAAKAFSNLLTFEKYADDTIDNKISVKPMTSTVKLDEIDKRLLEPVYMYAVRCLVCDIEVPVSFLGGEPVLCSDCKKTIKFIKEKFKEELAKYEV